MLLATRRASTAASTADVAAVLDEVDAAPLLERSDDAGLASARRWATSCSVRDVPGTVRGLAALGLLPDLHELPS